MQVGYLACGGSEETVFCLDRLSPPQEKFLQRRPSACLFFPCPSLLTLAPLAVRLGEAPMSVLPSTRGSSAPASFTLLEAGRPEWSSSLQSHAPLPHGDTVTALVPPGDKLRVPLVFLPRGDAAASDVVIIR